jgi:ATP-dependent exoDNAse (exonuclease V) alpha subunit
VAEKKYITLTSHNHKADRINQEALTTLPGKIYEFKGAIEGDFPEKALPTEITLQLKEGAQVMFIRNDKSEDRRYFNGKIATVKKIDESGIRVAFDEAGDELLLEKEMWNNIRYSYNAIDEKIDEEKLGSFSQYPVRLAWAITIHKSQGLTFEHAIIDAGESFAPGQVYVALSRCVSLDGMVLHSKIERKSISTHAEVISFTQKEIEEAELSRMLQVEKHVFLNTLLLETFDLQHLIDTLTSYREFIQSKRLPDIESSFIVTKNMLSKAEAQQSVALKFKPQLETLIRENDIVKLKERVSKAIDYFTKALTEELLNPIDKHIASLKDTKRVKKYLKQVRMIRLMIVKKIHSIQNARLGDISLNTSQSRISVDEDKKILKQKKLKVEKGSSLHETRVLFDQGNSIAEIAAKRNLAFSTIEGHIAMLVGSGEVDIHRVMSEDRLNKILSVIREEHSSSMTSVKVKLGDEYSFGEIRVATNYLDFLSKESVH